MPHRVLIVLLGIAAIASAEITGLRIIERSPVLDGKKFGKVGAYERVVARASFEADQAPPANKIVHDLELAPRNAKGRVEYSADVYILRPVEPQLGNGTVMFEVSNRGGKGLLRLFTRAKASGDPRTEEEFGDGFLLNQGYTLVWVGWQFDLLKREHSLRLQAPVAKGVTGWTRSHFSPSGPAIEFSVAGAGHQTYPAIDPADPESKLIVRDYQDGPGKEIPRKQWRFRDPETVTLDGGFAAGKTYDVIYRAKDPGIAGLGAAAIRDFVSFLKFGAPEELGELNALHADLSHAIAFGSSQSGRFLRSFVYEGFNADESGRQVFDGVWPHIAGAARGSFLHRFAQPTRQDPFYTVEIFPFRDLPDEDPRTRQSAGILSRAEDADVTPKIVYTLTSSEYWNRSASLLHTTLDGNDDAPLAEGTRIYYFAGTQHGSGTVPPRTSAALEHPLNANGYSPLMRAILVGFEDWIKNGNEPPPSRYPRVKELAGLPEWRFPRIPGLRTPGHQRRAVPLDFGPEYHDKGIITIQPPRELGAPYSAKLPQLDADGNELGGIRLPMISAPLASFTGWNRYKAQVSASDANPGNSGATLAFAWSKSQRAALGDPRRSVEERYESREAYQTRLKAEAGTLVSDGYLLDEDAPLVVEQALSLWDHYASAESTHRNSH